MCLQAPQISLTRSPAQPAQDQIMRAKISTEEGAVEWWVGNRDDKIKMDDREGCVDAGDDGLGEVDRTWNPSFRDSGWWFLQGVPITID